MKSQYSEQQIARMLGFAAAAKFICLLGICVSAIAMLVCAWALPSYMTIWLMVMALNTVGLVFQKIRIRQLVAMLPDQEVERKQIIDALYGRDK